MKGGFPVLAPTKKLGELLVEAGLLTPAQLAETLRHQRFQGGRMGSNLVSLGFISEEVLLDFLAQQTGVPRLDPQMLENIKPEVLKRIPQRMAEQLTILPLAFKEPKSLIVAMADPSDLNALDSARFASGLGIEPMVASHSMLRAAIADKYRQEQPKPPTTFEVGRSFSTEEALPVSFEVPSMAITPSRDAKKTAAPAAFGADPFFDDIPVGRHLEAQAPIGTFSPNEIVEPIDPFGMPSQDITEIASPPSLHYTEQMTTPLADGSVIVHARVSSASPIRKVTDFGTRDLLLGLVRVLQRRGLIGEEEVQRTIQSMIELGEIKPE